MTKRLKVLVAMSGGVDSSVAAAKVVEAGHEAVGVHMALNRNAELSRVGSRGCCTVEDAFDARRAADALGMPFYVWDLSEDFHDAVVKDFVQEYAEGRTPNPCVRCNEHIKFAELMRRAMSLGFDAVATGHYARTEVTDDDDVILRRSVDSKKDQSYVVAVMGRESLRRSIFPLGEYASKDEVRAEAARLGFATASKPDSHDICFIPDGDTRGFLDKHIERRPGKIVDASGEQVGEHDGAVGYTIGQRRGLRLGTPAADGKPRYVLDVSVKRNEITVGGADELAVSTLFAGDVVELAECPGPGEELQVQVRAHGIPVACTAVVDGDALVVTLLEPLNAVAAGQTVVVYRGDRVVCCATAVRCE